jgi:peptidoglycan-N-acetylglucosamine deacetylase
MLERLIEYINGHAGVSWLTMEEIAADFRKRQPFASATVSGR